MKHFEESVSKNSSVLINILQVFEISVPKISSETGPVGVHVESKCSQAWSSANDMVPSRPFT